MAKNPGQVASISEDLIYVCVSDPVDINPDLFRMWTMGYSPKETLEKMKETAMGEFDMRGMGSQRQLHRLFQCIEKDIIDQFRVFSMLELSFRRPGLRPFKLLPIHMELEKQLVEMYFDIDEKVVREVLVMRQSTKLKKRIHDMASKWANESGSVYAKW
eukprot:CAMPEP_0184496774 /NCGR_PEP_ID=MMETSP0113_2-20130426/34833_1 /TAXON_ID=91329 /ORGANISM="Norrisiella sphaerica, Strain BC52" /LENGTH=158 /DNA_ID=CAMNT_0026883567 /DNA_START=73 /DNA_END=547 /DNA_ORIENTATION=+